MLTFIITLFVFRSSIVFCLAIVTRNWQAILSFDSIGIRFLKPYGSHLRWQCPFEKVVFTGLIPLIVFVSSLLDLKRFGKCCCSNCWQISLLFTKRIRFCFSGASELVQYAGAVKRRLYRKPVGSSKLAANLWLFFPCSVGRNQGVISLFNSRRTSEEAPSDCFIVWVLQLCFTLPRYRLLA